MSVRASLLQSEQSSGNSISKNKKAANSGIVTVGLCLPEGEEGTVAVGAVAEEESRALKQAKKHPMVVVGEQDRETNLNVEASSSSSSSSGQSVSWKRLGAGKLTLRLYYFLFSFSFCFGGKCVCEKWGVRCEWRVDFEIWTNEGGNEWMNAMHASCVLRWTSRFLFLSPPRRFRVCNTRFWVRTRGWSVAWQGGDAGGEWDEAVRVMNVCFLHSCVKQECSYGWIFVIKNGIS